MGNALPGAQRKLVVLEQDPLTWRLEHIVEIRKKYLKEGWDLAVDKDQLSAVVNAVLPDPTGHDIVEEQLWRKYHDHVHGGSEVNVLEVFAGLAVITLGAFEEKARFVFSLFDFNETGSLGYNEILVMLYTALSGTLCYVGRGAPPTDQDLEKHVDHMYDTLGRDVHERIDEDQMIAYYKIRIRELCEARGVDLCDTAMIFLFCYDMVTHAMLDDAPSTKAIVLNSEDIGFD